MPCRNSPHSGRPMPTKCIRYGSDFARVRSGWVWVIQSTQCCSNCDYYPWTLAAKAPAPHMRKWFGNYCSGTAAPVIPDSCCTRSVSIHPHFIVRSVSATRSLNCLSWFFFAVDCHYLVCILGSSLGTLLKASTPLALPHYPNTYPRDSTQCMSHLETVDIANCQSQNSIVTDSTQWRCLRYYLNLNHWLIVVMVMMAFEVLYS